MGMAIRRQAKGLREERCWSVAPGTCGKAMPLKDEKSQALLPSFFIPSFYSLHPALCHLNKMCPCCKHASMDSKADPITQLTRFPNKRVNSSLKTDYQTFTPYLHVWSYLYLIKSLRCQLILSSHCKSIVEDFVADVVCLWTYRPVMCVLDSHKYVLRLCLPAGCYK